MIGSIGKGHGVGRLVSLFAAVFAVASLLFGCDYARMIDDEAVDTYEMEMPKMPKGTVPLDDPHVILKTAPPEELKNPIPVSSVAAERGREVYEIYCSQCHGPFAKGFGTVGQSFAPLPANLHSARVQSLSDGLLFKRINMGYRRHPPMAYTITGEQAWLAVDFIRRLEKSSRQ